MILDRFFDAIDERLFHIVTHLPSRDSDQLSEEQKAHRQLKIENDVAGHLKAREHLHDNQAAFDIFAVIDAKTSSLLTHVSVMIAANALVISQSNSIFVEIFCVALLLCFICVAMLTLRLLRFWTREFPGSNADDMPVNKLKQVMRDRFSDEIFYRMRLYRIALNLTTALTFISFFGILAYVAIEMAS